MRDQFKVVRSSQRHAIKIDRSEFIGVTLPLTTEADFTRQLDELRKEHFDATHHCWAFRLIDGERTRASDDGEPSGTAGRPILGAIEAADLWDVGVVVIRYYGGVKLGTGGLARAYRQAAAEVLSLTAPVQLLKYRRLEVSLPFALISNFYRFLSPPDIRSVSETFDDAATFVIEVRASRVEEVRAELTEKRFSVKDIE